MRVGKGEVGESEMERGREREKIEGWELVECVDWDVM